LLLLKEINAAIGSQACHFILCFDEEALRCHHIGGRCSRRRCLTCNARSHPIAAKTSEGLSMSKKLTLRIHAVKCIDETNGKYVEKLGNDEIYLGGHHVLADGATNSIAPKLVYAHFDDGDVKTFDPPWDFHAFTVGAKFPAEFAVGLTLVEKDEGGMTQAIKVIADQVEIEVKKRLPEARAKQEAKMAELKSGGREGPALLLPILKEALKVAAPYILAFVKNKVMKGIKDDVFPPEHVSMLIPNANHSWAGAKTSARSTVTSRGHGGCYAITYDWKYE
jgi:hypothetical protein